MLCRGAPSRSLPAVTRSRWAVEAACPWTPFAPVPGIVGISQGSQQLLVGYSKLSLIALVLIVRSLAPDIEAIATDWVGVNISHVIAAYPRDEPVRW